MPGVSCPENFQFSLRFPLRVFGVFECVFGFGALIRLGKVTPFAGAMLGFAEQMGMKPTYIKLEPEGPKPKKKPAKKKAVK